MRHPRDHGPMATPFDPPVPPPGRRALRSLNFFMADMQAGVGTQVHFLITFEANGDGMPPCPTAARPADDAYPRCSFIAE